MTRTMEPMSPAFFAAAIMIARSQLVCAASEMATISVALHAGVIEERNAVALLEAEGVLPLVDDVLATMEVPA